MVKYSPGQQSLPVTTLNRISLSVINKWWFTHTCYDLWWI